MVRVRNRVLSCLGLGLEVRVWVIVRVWVH